MWPLTENNPKPIAIRTKDFTGTKMGRQEVPSTPERRGVGGTSSCVVFFLFALRKAQADPRSPPTALPGSKPPKPHTDLTEGTSDRRPRGAPGRRPRGAPWPPWAPPPGGPRAATPSPAPGAKGECQVTHPRMPKNRSQTI